MRLTSREINFPEQYDNYYYSKILIVRYIQYTFRSYALTVSVLYPEDRIRYAESLTSLKELTDLIEETLANIFGDRFIPGLSRILIERKRKAGNLVVYYFIINYSTVLRELE
jgi:hypothetical protein